MKRKILLTGVTGFLGSHLAKTLLAANYEVVALKRKKSSLRRIESIAAQLDLVNIENLDFKALFAQHSNIDTIIHTATAYGRHDESVSEIFSANTGFPLQLLDAGSKASVKVFINTDTILDKYLNLYSLSKNQLLQWGKFFSLHRKIKFVNLRLEHFYGANDDATKFTTHVIKNCLANTPELALTLGKQERDFIYIDDVVTAYMLVLEKAVNFEHAFTEFDVGSGQSISIRSFTEAVLELTDSRTHLDFGAIPYRIGEVMRSEADISGLSALGWKCQYDVTAGLKIVIAQEKDKQ